MAVSLVSPATVELVKMIFLIDFFKSISLCRMLYCIYEVNLIFKFFFRTFRHEH